MSGKITSKIARHVHVEKGHGPLLGIVVSLRHKRSHQVVLNFKYVQPPSFAGTVLRDTSSPCQGALALESHETFYSTVSTVAMQTYALRG